MDRWRLSKRCTVPREDEDLARHNLRALAFDGKGESAFEAVGGLFVAVVAVRAGDFAPGDDIELERGDRAVCFIAFHEVTDSEAADLDLFL